MKRSDILWDLNGPEWEKPELADTGAASEKEGLGSVLGGTEQEDRFTVSPAPLPASYQHQTAIMDNNTEMLKAILKGMRQ